MILITETWLTPSVLDSDILPSGYSIFRCDRPYSRGGGVMIAVASVFNSFLVFQSRSSEFIAIKILSSPPLVIACAYVPPLSNSTTFVDIISSCHQVIDSSCHFLLAGDFNLPSVNWRSLSANSDSAVVFCDGIFSLHCSQVIDFPTHRSNHILDLLFSNSPDDIYNLASTNSSTCSSDHFMINFSLALNIHQRPASPVPKLIFKNVDIDSFCFYLETYLSFPDPLVTDVNILWSQFFSVFNNAIHFFVPSKMISHNLYPPWFTGEIRHKLHCLRSLKRLLISSPSPSRHLKATSLELSLDQCIANAKCSYISRLMSKFHFDPRSLFRHLRSLCTPRCPSPVVFLDSTPVTNPFDIACCFNQHFNSIFVPSCDSFPSFDSLPTRTSQLSFIHIDDSDVFDAISSLPAFKASGCDGFPSNLLRSSCSSIVDYVSHLFRFSINNCSVPLQWKIHKIIPVLKKGDPTLVSNYRPISLLCLLSKALESIILRKILPFIAPQIHSSQFGFMKNRSCLSQLLLSYSIISDGFDNRTSTDIIFTDFSKAFDSVSFNHLLFKLWSMGITGSLWQWFHNYLSDRQHFVEYSGSSSPLLPVLSGVPQGAILSPLLFLVYVNDIPSVCNRSSAFSFADDFKLILTIKDSGDSSLLQDDLDSLSLWCSTFQLQLNLSKCVYMHFSISTSETSSPHYNLDGLPIQPVSSHKDLGVTVSSNFSWGIHYSNICQSAYCSLNFIKRTCPSSTSINIRKSLYLSLVRSKLTYCSQLWRPYFIKDILLIEKIQRRATKFITCYDPSLDYKSRLSTLHVLPLMMFFELLDLLFLIKCLKSPSVLNFNIYDYVSFSHTATRSATHKKLQYRFHSYNSSRHYYFSRIVRLWNILPPIDLSLSLPTIKTQLYKIFWHKFSSSFVSDSPCTYHFSCPCSSCHSLSCKSSFYL